MAINLTLNDFRSVLGNVNDGNIVLKQDQSGIEKANYFHRGTGGATFALNPDTGALTLITSERLDALGEEAFFAFVEKFVNTLAVWNGISDGSRPSAELSAEPQDDAPDAPAFAYDAGFMQV